MVRVEAVFEVADSLTPDIAAKLTQHADRYGARLHLECDGKRVRLNSLIGILSLVCHRGMTVAVIAEGDDAQAAAEDIRAVLEGR